MFLADVGEYIQKLKGDLLTKLIKKQKPQGPIKPAQVVQVKAQVVQHFKYLFEWQIEGDNYVKVVDNAFIQEEKTNKLSVFTDQKWEYPRSVQLKKFDFDSYQMNQIKKIKCRRKLDPISNQLEQSFCIMKVVVNRSDVYYAADPSIVEEYFKKIILVKLCLYQFALRVNSNLSQTKGNMLKKSNFFGIWENIYATFDQKEGLACFAKQNQPCDLQIKCIHEIWTWFDLIEDENYLVIKIKQFKSKRQFAIRLRELTNWIPVFMKLLTKPQI